MKCSVQLAVCTQVTISSLKGRVFIDTYFWWLPAMNYISGLFIISVFSFIILHFYQQFYQLSNNALFKTIYKRSYDNLKLYTKFAVYLLALAVHCSFGFPLFWYDSLSAFKSISQIPHQSFLVKTASLLTLAFGPPGCANSILISKKFIHCCVLHTWT